MTFDCWVLVCDISGKQFCVMVRVIHCDMMNGCMNKWIGNSNLQMDRWMSTEGNDLTVIRIWGDVGQFGCKEIEVMTLSGDQLYRFYRLDERKSGPFPELARFQTHSIYNIWRSGSKIILRVCNHSLCPSLGSVLLQVSVSGNDQVPRIATTTDGLFLPAGLFVRPDFSLGHHVSGQF